MTRIGTGRLRSFGLLLTALLLAAGALSAFTTSASAAVGGGASAQEATSENGTNPTTARRAARRKNFGSIALNVRTGMSGWSYDKKNKKKAKKAAKRHCRKRSKARGVSPKGCKPVVWVRNGCAAIAVKLNKNNRIKRVGWGIAFNQKKAMKKARKKAGKKSKKHTWVCTTRYR